MKKSVIVLPAVLAVVFVLLSFIDRSDYALEKSLWQYQRQVSEIARDPKVIPDNQFEMVVGKYQALIRQYPDSRLISQAYLQIGRIYTLKKDFGKAKESFSEILRRFPKDQDAGAAALLGTGAVFENEKNEAQVVKTYRKIATDYPLTDAGLNMPIYIANYYLRRDRNVEADEALREAEGTYKKIAGDHPNTPARFNALRLLATTYLAERKWDEALNVLQGILFEYARSPYLNWQRAEVVIRSINVVAVGQLKDYSRAITIYQKFIEQNPNHPLNKNLKELITALQQSKNSTASQ